MADLSQSGSYRHPDPIVTGSLYCSGCLDEVLLGAMVPFREALRELGDGEVPYLWCVRYSRGGEHLKVRVHAPPDLESGVRERLERVAADFLAVAGPPPEGVERRIRHDAIPIDEEDRAGTGPPDRTFQLTHYQKSPVSLGGEPFLSDDGYRARMTVCLARGCDQVLSALAGQGQKLSHPQRQRLLFRAVLTGLGALLLPVDQAAGYLTYHRDWLIRFPLLREGGDAEQANAFVADLDRQADRSEPTLAALRGAIEPMWRGEAADAGLSPLDAAWGRGLVDLREHVATLCREPDSRLDPFAEDPAFNPLFKAFHGLANQLGLKWIDEAYAYHLLLRAASPDHSRHHRIALIPG
jgi:hypothetical protein